VILTLKASDIGDGWRLPDDAQAAIIVGDSVHEVLPRLAPGSIDGTVMDPPYSSGGAFRGDRSKGTGEKYLTDNDTSSAGQLPDFFGDTRSAVAYLFWLQQTLALCFRASVEGGFVAAFTDWRQLGAVQMALEGSGYIHRGTRPWVKPSGAYRIQWMYPAQDAEFCLWGTRGPLLIPDWTFDVSPPSPWIHKAPRGDQKRHQTEKPLGAMRDLCRVVRPDGVILDPFAGSGTTLEAALIEGRRAIGVEMSADYARVIADRLGAVAPAGSTQKGQANLFGATP
jgi:site-specific DNA-methyltransferase (adenine-specific)